jgi:hypothetical protein
VLVGDTLVAVDARSTKVNRHKKSLYMRVYVYIGRCVSMCRGAVAYMYMYIKIVYI